MRVLTSSHIAQLKDPCYEFEIKGEMFFQYFIPTLHQCFFVYIKKQGFEMKDENAMPVKITEEMKAIFSEELKAFKKKRMFVEKYINFLKDLETKVVAYKKECDELFDLSSSSDLAIKDLMEKEVDHYENNAYMFQLRTASEIGTTKP